MQQKDGCSVHNMTMMDGNFCFSFVSVVMLLLDFHPDNRWGNFWSVGAGWLLSKEKFLENQSWIDMLKFKISYGLQGNDNLMFQGGLYRNYYPYQDQYTLANSNGDFQLSIL